MKVTLFWSNIGPRLYPNEIRSKCENAYMIFKNRPFQKYWANFYATNRTILAFGELPFSKGISNSHCRHLKTFFSRTTGPIYVLDTFFNYLLTHCSCSSKWTLIHIPNKTGLGLGRYMISFPMSLYTFCYQTRQENIWHFYNYFKCFPLITWKMPYIEIYF